MTAREPAESLWGELPIGAAAWLDREAWIDGVEVLFKVHAKDQRHLCAESVFESNYSPLSKTAAHALAMNAPRSRRTEMKPLAWLVEDLGVSFTTAANAAEVHRVTPLVAAPPAQAVAEVAEMVEGLIVAAQNAESCGDPYHKTARLEAALEDAKSDLIAFVSCAAPPEGAPSYSELVETLRRFEEDFAIRVESWGLNPRQRELHADAIALLSRLPRQEGTDR